MRVRPEKSDWLYFSEEYGVHLQELSHLSDYKFKMMVAGKPVAKK
jgi:hypothetical protein